MKETKQAKPGVVTKVGRVLRKKLRRWGRISDHYFKYPPMAVEHARISFSQFGEDLLLETLLEGRNTGFYVDIGAYSSFRYSNTYRFYARGWRGINVEPNPNGQAHLVKHRPKDINVPVAITSSAGEVEFFMHEHPEMSGIADGQYAHVSGVTGKFRVRTMTLTELLETQVPAEVSRIDFMTMDCEGHEEVILKSNDWERFRPEIVAAEDLSKGRDSALDQRMSALGYELVSQLHVTKFYRTQDVKLQRTNRG
jgi:FkbM family methyltransferase